MNKIIKRVIKIGVFIGAVTATMHFINRYIEKASNLIDKLKTKENCFYKWRLGNVYYEKTGEGSPILLIHDYTPYASSYEWGNIINKLAESHTVYTIDLLGCGRSDRPAIEYTNFMYVQMISDFINDVIRGETDIITSGYSSSIAIMATNYTCEYIGKLLLINPGDLEVINRKSCVLCKAVKTILESPVLGTFLYNIFTLRSNIDYILTEKYFYNPFSVHTDIVDTYYHAAHKGHGNGKYILASIIANFTSANIEYALKNCKNEIYIIGGKHYENIDKIIEDYRNLKPDIESVILTKAKKLPHFEISEEVLTQINDYIG